MELDAVPAGRAKPLEITHPVDLQRVLVPVRGLQGVDLVAVVAYDGQFATARVSDTHQFA